MAALEEVGETERDEGPDSQSLNNDLEQENVQSVHDIPIFGPGEHQDIESVSSDYEIDNKEVSNIWSEVEEASIWISEEVVVDNNPPKLVLRKKVTETHQEEEVEEENDLNLSNHEEEIDLMLNNSDTEQDDPELNTIEERRNNLNVKRETAKRGIEEEGNKMIERSSKRLKTLTVGESCTVKIPDVDRGRGDLGNVIVRVMSIDHLGLMTLGSKFGLLQGKFTRSEVFPCDEIFLNEDDVPDKQLSMRELGRQESNGSGQGFFKCACKSKCIGRCKCKRHNVLCNSKCHTNRSTCDNKH